MDFGSEISKKIKEAIKTKLQDLGSYVDDELPEYIMVMLGNKRSKDQMTEDLMLFLGENTVKFIDWLINLVDKLKDVTSLIDSLPTDNATILTSHGIVEATKVEEKIEQNTKQNETKERKKSPRPTSKENSQSKSGKAAHSESTGSRVSSSVNKHGGNESRLSSIRKRRMSESDEEGAPQRMPSVVKVQEKRPSLPPSKQATSSLLKRAVAEAHLSVTKLIPSHSHTYDPTSPPSPIKVHSIEEKRQQKEILLQQHRELQKQLKEKEAEVTEVEESKNGDYGNSVDEEIVKVEPKSSLSENHTSRPNNTEVVNEPLIELQVSEAEALEYSTETVKGDTRIVAFADSQTVNDSEEEKHKRRKKRAVKSRERPRSPKFIVTLDGVDSELEDKYEQCSKKARHKKQKIEFDDYIDVDTSNMVTSQTIPSAPAPQKPEYLPPAVEQVMFVLDNTSDDEEMQHIPVSSKPQERCRFWPDCNNGTKCPFYHPTAPCRTFPNCKFADNCMFIHPLCKFDGRCTNDSCPFNHKLKNKVKTPIAAPVPVEPQIDDSLPALPQMTPCKFFPGCTRSKCPFLHPKPNVTKVCRYGGTCSRIDCKFSHPPSKAALKWVSPSLHLSERTFAVPADTVTKMPVAL